MNTADRFDWESYASDFRKTARRAQRDQHYIRTCLAYAEPLVQAGLPIIYDGPHFCRLVGYLTQFVYGAANAPHGYYREFTIPKKNKGVRVISEPLPSLKEIQRWILDNILSKIPVAAPAKAYVEGGSILENARFHRKQPLVVRIDLKDFFPSVRIEKVVAIFLSVGYCKPVATLLAKLCVYKGGLPQGAPTSPALSNLIFRLADRRLLKFAQKLGLRYTRYADDLTFSGNIDVVSVLSFVRRVVSKEGLSINGEKTLVMKRGQRQVVTGVVVNEKMQVPRSTRHQLRQEVHYVRKFGPDAHIARQKIRNKNYLDHLIGKVTHVLAINPRDDFFQQAFKDLCRIKQEISI